MEKKEIDWSKIPKWTKVQVKDYPKAKWHNAYFCEYKEIESNFNYRVTKYDEFVSEDLKEDDLVRTRYRCCRIHPSVTIPEEWYK